MSVKKECGERSEFFLSKLITIVKFKVKRSFDCVKLNRIEIYSFKVIISSF